MVSLAWLDRLDARQSVFIGSIILFFLAGPFWHMPCRKTTSSLKNTYKEKSHATIFQKTLTYLTNFFILQEDGGG